MVICGLCSHCNTDSQRLCFGGLVTDSYSLCVVPLRRMTILMYLFRFIRHMYIWAIHKGLVYILLKSNQMYILP